MNFLRSSPFSALVAASALQDFIFSCCGVSFFSSEAGAAAALLDRHSLINFLRSSPFNALVFASALHVFIFSCCCVAASTGRHKPAKAARTINLFIATPLYWLLPGRPRGHAQKR